MKSMFRSLVILSMSMYIFWFILPHITYQFDLYSREVSDILSWTGFDALLSFKGQEIIGYSFLLFFSIVSIGLYQFKLWAKKAFVILSVTSFLSTPFYGVLILPPFEATLLPFLNFVDGMILSLMYFSSLKNEFK